MFGRKEDLIVVKKWLRYSDFKEAVSDEKFERIDLSAFKCIGRLPEIQISANWIVIDRVYIPKKMLFDFVCTDFDRVTIQDYNEIRAITLNGYEFIVIKIKRDQVRSFINRIKLYIRDVPGSVCNEFVVRGMPYSKFFSMGCKKYLQEQEDFRHFCNISRDDRENYLAMPLIAEDILHIFIYFTQRHLTFGTKYFWKENIKDRKVFSPDRNCEIEFRADANSADYIIATIHIDETVKEVAVLKRAEADFNNNTEINRASAEFCDALRKWLG